MVIASILIPTHNHGELINFAVQSVLEQTVQDFELFIIGDGPTKETRVAAQALVNDKVKYEEFPKAGRTGEPHRHHVITKKTTGKYIFYLSDDDIWTKRHLETMLQALQSGNFCHSKYIEVMGKPRHEHLLPNDKKLLIKQNFNFIPLSCGAHSRGLYAKLKEGWTETPEKYHTDHYMWKKLVSHPDCLSTSSKHTTVINFPSKNRMNESIDSRKQEIEKWLAENTQTIA
jgi:glycosyltransferase involved in cell wall biosynthesis